MADALTLEDVHTYYGDAHVLHGVTFAVGTGRLVALLGRNGAGKTTTIRTIVGFTPPRRGQIRLFGEPIAGLDPETIARRGVGLVPQGRRIFPSLTVSENLTVAARRRPDSAHPPWTLERVLDLFPRLGDRQRQPAGTLSGGEQQMLAIGRALMTNPRLLLLDEPSEGLAPQIVHEVRQVLQRLKNEGFSVVLVEQNIRLALDIADEVVILNNGRVVFEGDPAAIARDEAFLALHLGVH
ncbi:MAG TPA: ABC transporter ATP-binding protein [Candidatus Binatia bacterium]|nr:ABC transporter ATP-binding protein [Candidatus Binatia bacterium]